MTGVSPTKRELEDNGLPMEDKGGRTEDKNGTGLSSKKVQSTIKESR
jgi:hypothetical protein